MLRERVAHARRPGDERGRRDRLHQVALALLDHRGHHRLRGPHVRQEVDADDALDLFDGGGEAGSGVADAGVGAEHVHRAVRVHRLRDEIGDG